MDENIIKPYGDTLNDSIIQLSFTLPVENGTKARKAAEIYVSKLNFEEIEIVHAQKIAENFTCFIVYAKAKADLDYSTIEVSETSFEHMDFYEINRLIEKEIGHPLSAVGATIGSDAHTVGIDAIMNMKGFKQDYGLERYPQIKAYNLGAQVTCQTLIDKAIELNADAILVSQTVTQKESHLKNFTELITLLGKKGLKGHFLLLAGGAKVNNELALKLGYDAGFGSGTVPSQVASFLVAKLMKKNETHIGAENSD